MTPQQIVAIGMRLLAVWLGVTSLSYLATIPLALGQYKIPEAAPLSYTTGAIYLILGLVLWFFPMAIAHKVIPALALTTE